MMKRRIYLSMCALSLCTVLLTATLIAGVIYVRFYESMRQGVRNEAHYIAAALNLAGDRYLLSRRNAADTSRLTLVMSDGSVVFDSAEDPTRMENHLHRTEIDAALRTGSGEASRLSQTFGVTTFYYALRLDDGRVLRVSNTADSVYTWVLRTLPYMLLAVFAVFLVSTIAAARQTKSIVTPINALNLDDPLSNVVYEELSPLLVRISKQKMQIDGQMRELMKKQDEFAAVTGSMNEGLAVLNAKLQILSINQSALRFFGLPSDDWRGRHILATNRSAALQTAVERAARGEPQSALLSLNGRHYQLFASPVKSSDAISGLVLLLHDVTERHEAEQLRREFSANVSHELKTPLTSISGYAEIIQNGLVKPADIPLFAERIRTEATRLLALIEDIIKLSSLDEGRPGVSNEPVDLLALSQQIVQRNVSPAAEKGVSVSVRGESTVVNGARPVLDEMISNLLLNAIKYNREHGSVEISVSHSPAQAVLAVSDTGIGIPREHQSRVFERFYRVDKSHSRDTGGTGLGLSIVKHGALCHGATVELSSEPGRGTTVRIVFPI